MAQTSAPTDRSRGGEERLQRLYAQWHDFRRQFEQAIAQHHEMRKTNLRGSLILIEREIRRLGGTVPEAKSPPAH